MSVKRTGLGRGLDALLGDASAPVKPVQTEAREGLRQLPVDLLQRGEYQPRQDMHQESLEDLARSIKAQGLVQPIVVRPLPTATAAGETRYEIIAKVLADAKNAGMVKIGFITNPGAKQQ